LSTDISAQRQEWQEAERRASAAEHVLMDTIRLVRREPSQAVRDLRSNASECLERLLAEVERPAALSGGPLRRASF